MASHPEFGESTSAIDVASTFASRIKNRNVLITGVSPGGIGEGTALAFASQSPQTLLLASRTPSNLSAVAQTIRSLHPSANLLTIPLDLASQASIRSAAALISSHISHLDLLINNAGATLSKRTYSPEGIEVQFAANHLGPFLLTNLLLPLLEKAAKREGVTDGETRVVNLASGAHRISPIRFHDYNYEGKDIPEEERHVTNLPPAFLRVDEQGYNPVVAYAQSKTANILFTVSLQARLPKRGIAAYCVHPGGVRTHLGRDSDDEINAAIEKTSKYWKNPDEGSSTTLVAALDPALDEIKGLYMDNCQFKEAFSNATDPGVAERLWELSEKLVGQEFSL